MRAKKTWKQPGTPRSGSSGGQGAPRRTASAPSFYFLLSSWAPVLGGMLLFKETLLNYFLLIVTFPSLSSRRFSPKGNKPPAPHTPGRGGWPGPGREAHPKPRSREGSLASAFPLPPPTGTKISPQKPRKLPGHTECTRKPRHQSPLFTQEAGKLLKRARFVDL